MGGLHAVGDGGQYVVVVLDELQPELGLSVAPVVRVVDDVVGTDAGSHAAVLFFTSLLQSVGDGEEEEVDGGNALLPVNEDAFVPVALEGHDAAKEVVLRVVLQHLLEVVEEALALLLRPVVVTLEHGDGKVGLHHQVE